MSELKIENIKKEELLSLYDKLAACAMGVIGVDNLNLNASLKDLPDMLVKSVSTRASGWVSVDDGKPEVGEHVIALLDFGQQSIMVFSNLHEFKSPHHEHSSWSDSVTHWMLLPEPPCAN